MPWLTLHVQRHQLDFADGTFFVSANDLGLDPGKWPACIVVDGTHYYGSTAYRDPRTNERLTMVYKTVEGARLILEND